MAVTTDLTVRSQQIKRLLNNLLPEQCRKHVYKVDHEYSVVGDCEIVKWTFYNDQSIRLNVRANVMLDSGEVEPIIEDYEHWQADALMKCEAGEDVWPRPKPSQGFMGNQSQQSGQMNSLQNIARQQSLQGLSTANQQAAGLNAAANALGLGNIFK